MKTYWITFRIEKDDTYDDRYEALEEAITKLIDGDAWWKETTSFILFPSKSTLKQVAETVKKSIAEDRDIALIGMVDFKGNRVVGNWTDPDLQSLMPNVQQA